MKKSRGLVSPHGNLERERTRARDLYEKAAEPWGWPGGPERHEVDNNIQDHVPWLAKALSSPDEETRKNAAAALNEAAKNGQRVFRATSALLGVLDDPSAGPSYRGRGGWNAVFPIEDRSPKASFRLRGNAMSAS